MDDNLILALPDAWTPSEWDEFLARLKRGTKFLHAHRRDRWMERQLCVVTTVRRGIVYWQPVRGAHDDGPTVYYGAFARCFHKDNALSNVYALVREEVRS